MDDYPMYGLLVGFPLWGTLWRLPFPLGFWNTMTCRVEIWGGTSTTPYTKEQEEAAARILAEQKAKKEEEVVKQAKKLALLQEQAVKRKKLGGVRKGEKKKERKMKAADAEEEEKTVEEEVPLIRRSIWDRGETSGTKKEDSWLEKISKWVANLSLGEEEVMMLYVPREEHKAVVKKIEAEEKKLEWKLTDQGEEEENGGGERIGGGETAEGADGGTCGFSREDGGNDKEYRTPSTGPGGAIPMRLESTKRLCIDAIEGAKLAAPKEEEARPRRESVKVKFPDSYSGKEEENFDNWEANVNSYVHLQKISPDERVLIAFHALKDEAASFAMSLCRDANCNNDMVAYSALTPLSEFFKLLRGRFADVTGSVRAFDKLQTILLAHGGVSRHPRVSWMS
ncbi:hypothetical protein CBR_g9097 [Chara braunii]|uniref:Uncharacterized protein n=1 Tax=Chara braunii TaxID=69332 RepID=A0A388KNR2_CHABU|nr:hypothetical protein CBR_g9097 [Chara braunii]|eukprot:GBG71684.1 hypothetical protein CBR_g9097 [Chara braunii]